MRNVTEYPIRYCAAFIGNKSKAVELRKVESGGYAEDNEDDAAALVEDILKSGEPVSQWAVWDNRVNAPKARQAVPYTGAEFKALFKGGVEFALVWCKRGQFRAPVIKIGQLNVRPAAGKRAAPVRIGR
jgi:hypothetical protein